MEIMINTLRCYTIFSTYCENSQFHYSLKNAILKVYVDITIEEPELLPVK